MNDQKRDRAMRSDQLLGGGALPLRRHEVPSARDEDGRPGVVYVRPPSAREVVEITERAQAAEDDDLAFVERMRREAEIIAQHIVDEAGHQILDVEAAMDLPVDVFRELQLGITKLMQELGGSAGEASSEATSGASPTGSP